ncbi:hypothetical protein M3182_14325 [Mesobacillus maritimus]|uniref:hypothetical protein n=1 Tax=Mesobacillus maritimus TaxID=1643336 RepID=UPI00203CBBAA|nr:hypothetical protein [Mesobacillus maritimus]MCM3586911.1 hypothetical protein [Mesobacillus maritimus]MCM3668734.1 hypothetical protein [Mesobacillus maritimus]
MNNKLYKIIGGSALAAMLLTGCGTNDNDPAPPADGNGTNDGGTTEINDLNRNDRDNRIFNNNRNRDNDLFDNNNNRDNELFNDNNDMNRDNDLDTMRDRNTPGEDVIEDRMDANDRDRRDR